MREKQLVAVTDTDAVKDGVMEEDAVKELEPDAEIVVDRVIEGESLELADPLDVAGDVEDAEMQLVADKVPVTETVGDDE